jgi:hypothetical protein
MTVFGPERMRRRAALERAVRPPSGITTASGDADVPKTPKA